MERYPQDEAAQVKRCYQDMLQRGILAPERLADQTIWSRSQRSYVL